MNQRTSFALNWKKKNKSWNRYTRWFRSIWIIFLSMISTCIDGISNGHISKVENLKTNPKLLYPIFEYVFVWPLNQLKICTITRLKWLRNRKSSFVPNNLLFWWRVTSDSSFSIFFKTERIYEKFDTPVINWHSSLFLYRFSFHILCRSLLTPITWHRFVPVHMRMRSSLSIDILLMLLFSSSSLRFFDISLPLLLFYRLIRLNFSFSLSLSIYAPFSCDQTAAEEICPYFLYK